MDQQTRQLQREAASVQRKYIAAAGGDSCTLARAMSEGKWLGVPNHLFDETLPRLGGAATCLLLALMENGYGYDAEDNPALSKEYVRTSDLRPDTGLSRPALRSAAEQLARESLLPNGGALLEQKRPGRDFEYRLTDAAGPVVDREFTKLPRAVCCMAAHATSKESRSDLRCLLVIVRQTIGFGRMGAIVTHEDFKAGSSIEHSATIGNATGRLVEKGLVARARRRPRGFDYPTYLYALCPRLCALAEVAAPDRKANRGDDRGPTPDRKANRGDDRGPTPDRKANRGDDRKGNVVGREENSGDDRKGSELSERSTTENVKDDSRKTSSKDGAACAHDDGSPQGNDGSAAVGEEMNGFAADGSLNSDADTDRINGGGKEGRFSEALAQLRKEEVGMSTKQAKQKVSKYGAERVLHVVQACESRNDVNKLGAYITAALRKEWPLDKPVNVPKPNNASPPRRHPMYEKYSPSWEKNDD